MFSLFWIFMAAASICSTQQLIEAGTGPIDAVSTLDCHRRLYTYRVTKADENGKQCWDTLSVLSCWGRCDSNEVNKNLNFSFKINKKKEIFGADAQQLHVLV